MGSMSKQEVKCRCCGHRILAREIMRTDLYERAPGQNYVYIKFRCRRCKRMGQTFVPEARWDWALLEPARDELSDTERDRLSEVGPISEAEVLDFSTQLKDIGDLTALNLQAAKEPETPKPGGEPIRLDLKFERKEEKRKDDKRKEEPRDARRDAGNRGSTGFDAKGVNGAGNDARPDDHGNNA
jgi:hypothetical protein